MLLMSGTSLNYFHRNPLVGRRTAVCSRAAGKRIGVLCLSAFEEGRAREQIADAPDGEQPDVRTWQEDEKPYRLVAQGLKDRSMATGKLGIEETVRFFFADGIAKAAPQLTLTSATPVTAGCPHDQKRPRDRAMRLRRKLR